MCVWTDMVHAYHTVLIGIKEQSQSVSQSVLPSCGSRELNSTYQVSVASAFTWWVTSHPYNTVILSDSLREGVAR